MTLSRRNSRKIVVDDREYRWSPSRDSGFMVLVVQHSSGKGKKLEVVISDDQNIIVENGSYSIEYDTVGKLLITPKLVETLIREALKAGWNPEETGPPVQTTFLERHLETRRGL
ncbi:hypothetical protein [Gimesia chilikensis]|uniref:hypothetical protein n=1 Tax=Gimesia chilikensis TaxID=2605989 RepID=UPI003A912820